MLHSQLRKVRHSPITQWVVIAGLMLAILVPGGATQVSAQAPVTAQNLIKVVEVNPITLGTAASSSARLYEIVDGGFYLSTNSGADWTMAAAVSAPHLYPTSLASDPMNNMVVYLGTNYNSMFKSVDGGTTFFRSSAGLGQGSQVAVTAILLPALHPGLLMATTAYWVGTSTRTLVPQGLYLSTNKGQSWFQVSDALGDTAITGLELNSGMVVTALSADGSIQRIPLDTVLFEQMRYGTAEVRAQVPEAMAALGMRAGETELNRRFWTGEDLPATVRSLASLATPGAIRTLASGLGDTRETARWHLSMQTLEYMGEQAVPALITALSDQNPVLRANAAELLGWIGSRSAKPALTIALADEDQTVRAAATWALGEIR